MSATLRRRSLGGPTALVLIRMMTLRIHGRTVVWLSDGVRRLAVLVVLVSGLASCAPDPARSPTSFLLFVSDTTRMDAVSAYGRTTGTTPVTDGLAATGLRYNRAYANAPWTLPSHATLLSGLLPSQHGVGWARTMMPLGAVMLAEQLREAGYETVGVSENPWVTETFNMAQGFERFASVGKYTAQTPTVIAKWLHETRGDRPFFLFVNVIDAHAPYKIRADPPFLPVGVSPEAAQSVPQERGKYLCSTAANEYELSVLRGLYLGGVAAADAKLGEILRLLREAGLDRDLVTIVTSDHGEHFGEHRLVDHQFSIREELIHVPLVVHGLGGVSAGVIEQPVQLAGVTPSVLDWAGLPVPVELGGYALPTTGAGREAGGAVLAEYHDPAGEHAPDEPDFARFLRYSVGQLRAGCGPDDRVFGRMRALIRYPLKLVWYQNYPVELYDLSTDPEERSNLAASQPSVVAALTAEVERLETVRPLDDSGPEVGPVTVPEEIRERLRDLGYLADDHD